MIKDLFQVQFAHTESKTVTQFNYYKEHVHQRYELLYILNGAGKFLIEDVEYTFNKNSMFLIPPGKYHVMTKLPLHDYERVVVYFTSELLPTILDNRLYVKKCASNSTRDIVMKYCNYITALDDSVLTVLMQGFINEILLTEFYDSNGGETEQSNLPPLVKSAIDYINNNIDKPLTTKIIADALFVSNTHLGHVFSQTMNGGIMRYVQIKKIYRAQELIRSGKTATYVAETLGYKSYPTFIRNYKKYLGTNPSRDR